MTVEAVTDGYTVLRSNGAEQEVRFPECLRSELLDYARQRGLRPKGTCRHIYLEGPAHHSDANKFITQVAIPIE